LQKTRRKGDENTPYKLSNKGEFNQTVRECAKQEEWIARMNELLKEHKHFYMPAQPVESSL